MYSLTFLIAIFFTFSFCYAGKSKENNTVEINLVRHKSSVHQLLEMGFHPNAVDVILHKKKHKDDDRTNDTVQLFKYQNSEFYGEILLGKPGRTFKVIFDTAWGDSFVPSAKCRAIGCKDHNTYDSTRSSTYVSTNNTRFSYELDGKTISGILSEDLLHLGHLNVTNQTFGEALDVPTTFALSKTDGIFGMGLKDLGKYSTPFFYNLMNQKKKFKKIFSFYLNSAPSAKKGGSLILGAISKKHYNETVGISYFPVTSKYFWQVHMDRVFFKLPKGTQDYCTGGCDVYFDSGSSFISIPPKVLDDVNLLIGASKSLIPNRFSVDCPKITTLPHVHFVIGGKDFSLKGKEYIQKFTFDGATLCLSAFVSSGSDNLWGLGGMFFYRYYIVFDAENLKVGITPLIM